MRYLVVILFSLPFYTLSLNAQELCEIYNTILDTLKVRKVVSYNLPKGYQINPFNPKFDTLPKTENIYYYKFYIFRNPQRLNQYDLKYWLQKKFDIDLETNEYKKMRGNLFDCSFDKNVVFQTWDSNSRPIIESIDTLTQDDNGLTLLPLKVFLSDILCKKNENAFVYARCIYPSTGTNDRYYCFWFTKENKKANWKLKKVAMDVR